MGTKASLFYYNAPCWFILSTTAENVLETKGLLDLDLSIDLLTLTSFSSLSFHFNRIRSIDMYQWVIMYTFWDFTTNYPKCSGLYYFSFCFNNFIVFTCFRSMSPQAPRSPRVSDRQTSVNKSVDRHLEHRWVEYEPISEIHFGHSCVYKQRNDPRISASIREITEK